MRSQFGIFAPVFAPGPGYLALLGLHGPNAAESVVRVRECCARVPDPFPDICRLLGESNWRPQLVAAVAVILRGYHEEAVRLLWRRLDSGSWVTPQIGVALAMVDPDFLRGARSRLETRCPLDASESSRMSDLERHSAAGPADGVRRSAKAAQTLRRLVEGHPSRPKWLDELLSTPDFQELLGKDVDDSAGIVDEWSRRIASILSSGFSGLDAS